MPESADTKQTFWQRYSKPVISLFIILYIYATALQLAPRSIWRRHLQAPLLGVTRYLGLWQDFVTFAPNPTSSTLNLDARIKYDDGSQSTWAYPRAEAYKGVDRVLKDKYRRFLYRYLTEEKLLWPGVTNFIARQVDTPQKHPLYIELVKYVTPVPPLKPDGSHDQPVTSEEVFYSSNVVSTDLEAR